MAKKETQVTAIRDLIRNLGLLSKLLVEFIPVMEELMKTESDLKASLDRLSASVGALTTAVTNLPRPIDLAPDIEKVDSMNAQVQAAVVSLTPTAPPETPPATNG